MTEQDGLPFPQRNWAILTIVLGLVMAVMDGAIANVALPTIARDLHASPAFSIWIVNGYQLAITISLLPLASLGEIIGYRRVYLAGLLLFTLASLFCALSHTLLLLTVARILQGFGAAGILSVNAALVRFTYPRAQLGRGIGVNALGGRGLRRGGPDAWRRAFWRWEPGPICSPSMFRSASSTLALGRRTSCRTRPRRRQASTGRARCSQRGHIRRRHRRDRQRRPWRDGLLLCVSEFVHRRCRRRICW